LLPGHWISAEQLWRGPPANITLIVRSITSSSLFRESLPEHFKNFVATGASDEEVANWIERTAKKRPRIEIIKWDNDWRYKTL
jgi:Domain of unknown function (DUF5069)